MTDDNKPAVYLHASQMWMKDYFPGRSVIEIQPIHSNVCPSCGESEDADGYCPTVHRKLEEARAEFGDEAAHQIADEWDWFHRHPNADRWTHM